MFSRPATSLARRNRGDRASDAGLATYKKLVIANGRLIGAVLFGDTADGLWYLDLIRSGQSIDTLRDDLDVRPRDGRAKGGVMSSDFTPDQKRYLEGFASGLAAARLRAARWRPAVRKVEPSAPTPSTSRHRIASLAAGGNLPIRRNSSGSEHPFDAYRRLKEQARKNEAPKPADNFRWRYYGLFYVAPAQNSYMCRLRIPTAS